MLITLNNNQIRKLCKQLSLPVFLDGGLGTNNSGFDIFSAEPIATLQETFTTDSSLTIKKIKELESHYKLANEESNNLTELPFTKGILGFLSYTFGETLQLNKYKAYKNKHKSNNKIPSVFAGFYTWSYVFDHNKNQGYLTFSPLCNKETRQKILSLINNNTHAIPKNNLLALNQLTWRKSQSFESYKKQFSSIQDYIKSGDCYQVNLTQMFETSTTFDAADLYFETREQTQTPYSCFLSFNEHQNLLSFSPEQFIAIKDRVIESKPIKGTIANDGTTNNLNFLLGSTKNQAENVMIVDLIRNDLGKVCKPNSVHVPELFKLNSYKNVHHLVSHIKGHLKKEISELDAFLSCFPGGSITGAPKIRSMQIINELEVESRSAYCGSVFYLNQNSNFNSNILIRTVVKDKSQLYCWAGGGITADSEVFDEYQESMTKVANLTGINE